MALFTHSAGTLGGLDPASRPQFSTDDACILRTQIIFGFEPAGHWPWELLNCPKACDKADESHDLCSYKRMTPSGYMTSSTSVEVLYRRLLVRNACVYRSSLHIAINLFGGHTGSFINMSNFFRRASDAFHRHQHHQRKDSEDSVNQDSVASPAEESQEPQEPQEPQVTLVSPNSQEHTAETASGPGPQSDAKDVAGPCLCSA